MEIETPIKQGKIKQENSISFKIKKEKTRRVLSLCVFLKNSACFYFETGETFTIALPFIVHSVWSFQTNPQNIDNGDINFKTKNDLDSRQGLEGLILQREISNDEKEKEKESQMDSQTEQIPPIYSLSHPLEEFKPVTIQFQSISNSPYLPKFQQFLSPPRFSPTSIQENSSKLNTPNPNHSILTEHTPNIFQTIIGIEKNPCLIITYDSRTFSHSICEYSINNQKSHIKKYFDSQLSNLLMKTPSKRNSAFLFFFF